MSRRSTTPLPEARSPERRRFLRLAGAAPLLLPGAGWLVACGDPEARDPYAGEDAPDPVDVPDPAGAAGRASGSADAGTSADTGEPAGGSAAADAGEPAGGSAAADAGEPAGGSAAADAGESALVTEIAAMQATVEALQYTHESPKDDQRCANCQLYTAKTQQRGSCQLFPQGRVSAAGWCTSWVGRVTG